MTDNKPPSAEEVLRGETTIFLATSEGEQPRVRPVTLVESDGELFVLTGSKDLKVAQVQSNGRVECLTLVKLGDSTGYVRFSATASIEKDSSVRARLAKVASFFDQFWDSPEHPGYTLIRIRPVRIEYMKPGDMEPTPITRLTLE
jgi:general stress protein 26